MKLLQRIKMLVLFFFGVESIYAQISFDNTTVTNTCIVPNGEVTTSVDGNLSYRLIADNSTNHIRK